MKNETSVLEKIKFLEEKLINKEIRNSIEEISEIISDDFIEFGSFGNIYDKKAVIEFLRNEKNKSIEIEDFNVKFLSEGIFLALYKVVKTDEFENKTASLRSSIWKFNESDWIIIFHQGTVIKN